MNENPVKISYKEMCEVIEKAGILEGKDGYHPKAKEIFESQDALSQVPIWYHIACKKLEIVPKFKVAYPKGLLEAMGMPEEQIKHAKDEGIIEIVEEA